VHPELKEKGGQGVEDNAGRKGGEESKTVTDVNGKKKKVNSSREKCINSKRQGRATNGRRNTGRIGRKGD